MYSLSADEAREVCQRPLPYPDDLKQRVTPWDQALFPPLRQIAPRMPQWLERWNNEVGR